LLEAAAPENGFAQDAIDYAIVCGFQLTYQLEADVRAILHSYDAIIHAYHRHLNAAYPLAA
jgi:hypothetical protein